MPTEWRSIGNKISPIFARLHQAYSGTEFGSFKLQSIVAAMKIILVLDRWWFAGSDELFELLEVKTPPEQLLSAAERVVAAQINIIHWEESLTTERIEKAKLLAAHRQQKRRQKFQQGAAADVRKDAKKPMMADKRESAEHAKQEKARIRAEEPLKAQERIVASQLETLRGRVAVARKLARNVEEKAKQSSKLLKRAQKAEALVKELRVQRIPSCPATNTLRPRRRTHPGRRARGGIREWL
ncbi:MAG: hypothetical protein SGPRY_006101 [Prymnesium sp.]